MRFFLAAGVLLLLGSLAPPARALEPGEFDPAILDSLLTLYVRDGSVDYAAWREDGPEALDAFLADAAAYDPWSIMGKEPKAAFLTNLYNAWVIRQVLTSDPVESVQEIPGFFDANSCLVAGENRTLDDLEKMLADLVPYLPQFALLLVPGAAGAPALPSQALTSGNYQETLDRTASLYLTTERRMWYEKETRILHVPPQIGRHLDLCENTEYGIAGFAGTYLSLAEVMAMGRSTPEVVVEEMDWTLNAAPPPAPADAAEDSPEGTPGG